MFLKDFEFAGITVLKDGQFSHLSKTNSLSESGGNLVFLTDTRYLKNVELEKISCVITREELAATVLREMPSVGVAVSKDPKASFYKIHEFLIEQGEYQQLGRTVVSPSAKISEGAFVAEKNVMIGENTVIEEGVIIKENVILGNNCLVQSGTILGNDCFEVVVIDGVQKLVRHAGFLVVKDRSVIQSNCTVSKGLFPQKNTVIGEEVIVADLVHIAHGVNIGKRTKIAAGTIIAGNTFIGENVWIGPGAVISNNITVGNNAYITIGSVVVSDVKEGERVAGNFAVEYRTFLKAIGRNICGK